MHAIKRTTVALDLADQEALDELSTLQRTSEMEAIRKSIRLARLLLKWEQDGGEILLEREGKQKRLLFM